MVCAKRARNRCRAPRRRKDPSLNNAKISGCYLWALVGLCARDVEVEGGKRIKSSRSSNESWVIHCSAILASPCVCTGLLGTMVMVSHKLDDPRIIRRHRRDTALIQWVVDVLVGGGPSFEGVISGKLNSTCIGPSEWPLSTKRANYQDPSICAVGYEYCWPTPVAQE